jgi:hypothetical protein
MLRHEAEESGVVTGKLELTVGGNHVLQETRIFDSRFHRFRNVR